MSINAEVVIARMSPESRARAEAMAAQAIAEEMTLQQLRKARKITQAKLAKKLKVSQDGISRMEQRSDLLLSTLRKTIEAMGGNLSLVAQFPDKAPIVLAGLGEIGAERPK